MYNYYNKNFTECQKKKGVRFCGLTPLRFS
nr:MAG TPA: hypothetical protein [Caudoviricetes sp.]DAU44292.1 MAG TPA: hypothetical protein [Caudoviricetes sp.]